MRHRQAAQQDRVGRHVHEEVEVAEVGVDVVLIRPQHDQLTRLVGGHQQRDADLIEEGGEVGGTDAARRRHRAGLSGSRWPGGSIRFRPLFLLAPLFLARPRGIADAASRMCSMTFPCPLLAWQGVLDPNQGKARSPRRPSPPAPGRHRMSWVRRREQPVEIIARDERSRPGAALLQLGY